MCVCVSQVKEVFRTKLKESPLYNPTWHETPAYLDLRNAVRRLPGAPELQLHVFPAVDACVEEGTVHATAALLRRTHAVGTWHYAYVCLQARITVFMPTDTSISGTAREAIPSSVSVCVCVCARGPYAGGSVNRDHGWSARHELEP